MSLGDIHLAAAPPAFDDARQCYADAMARAAELGMRPVVAHCHLGFGRLYRRAAQTEQARGHLTTAVTMYREMDLPFWLEPAEAELQALDRD